MAFLKRLGIAAHHQTRVAWEEVIVIWTLTVLETLYAEKTTVKASFRPRILTGTLMPTAAQVYNISILFMYCLKYNYEKKN